MSEPGDGLADRMGAAPRGGWGWDEALAAIDRHSPFLSVLCRNDPDRLGRLASEPAELALDRIVAAQSGLAAEASAGLSTDALAASLRRNRSEHALLVALADLGSVWPVEIVTEALTRFADASVEAAVAAALHAAVGSGTLEPDAMGPRREGCGLTVLALGKHGARELNYSSDVDLVVFYDPQAPALTPKAEPSRLYNRMAQLIVKLLSERTPDGYVHRVDYRLRPDPGSTPAAISLPAAYSYYETVGQNWERAAMIKARAIAGDVALGEAFLAELEPFVWRKYFDFASIADIHAMKRQIHAVRGHDRIAVAGHDIKLGRGGIREIEFFVQTQQLVFGGRRPSLRGRRTLDMLAALANEGWITLEARDELSESYRFLRRIEHRLQMRADEQTQRLPLEHGDLASFAAFAGYRDVSGFSADLTGHAGRVQLHYARLFEDAPLLASDLGNLVFTGTEDDPATLATLERLGFRDGPRAAETIRGWHFGRRPAVRSPRAREVLTELVPPLLKALGGTSDPDGALARLDAAFARMPAAVELLTILRSQERLRTLFADLLGTAPRLADDVAARPHLLDAIIDPSFAEPVTDEAGVERSFQSLVGSPVDFEDFLDRSREAAHQLQFVSGARMLSGILPPAAAGAAYAAIAGAAIRAAYDWTSRALAAEHGEVPGEGMAVLGLGRLGAGELTASSDLDLVALYDVDEEQRTSNGMRPLDAAVYYGRLTQRLIRALTAQTRRGRLFEVDMRLRPSGTQGPVASQLSGFLRYHEREAEIWEQMALTRARALAGPPDFRRRVDGAIRSILRQPRERKTVFREVVAMRRLVAKEKPGAPDDLKLAPGGLLDLDFMAQALVLAHAHHRPELIGLSTPAVLRRAGALDLIPREDAAELVRSYGMLDDVHHWRRLTSSTGTAPGPDTVIAGARLASLVGCPDPRALPEFLADLRRPVRAAFERLLGDG